MISSLQPKRPRAQPSNTTLSSSAINKPPTNQQPYHAMKTPYNASGSTTSPSLLSTTIPSSKQPSSRSQIEALPPSHTPLTTTHAPLLQHQVPTLHGFQIARKQAQSQTRYLHNHDPARRHPVFFTERLKRAPNGVVVPDLADGGMGSPVTSGYVWEGGRGVRRREGEVRL